MPDQAIQAGQTPIPQSTVYSPPGTVANTPAPPKTQIPTGGGTANPANAGKPGFDVFGNYVGIDAQTAHPQDNTAKPQTAFSSDQGAAQVATNADKLQTLKNTGLTLGPDGLARYSDSSFATAPSDAMQNEDGTWQSGGVRYAIGPSTTADPELKAMSDQITQMKSQFDTTSRAAIDNIKAQFDNLIKQQGDINTRSQASQEQTLIMGGSQRYAQDSSNGQTTALMSYGLQQLADLNTKEQSAVIQAQQAMDSGDMKLMDSSLALAQKARDEKQAAAKTLSDRLQKQTDDLNVKKKQNAIDTAVGTQLSSGITDPAAIVKALAAQGITATAKDVADSISNLNPNAKEVAQVMADASKYGAPKDVLAAIGKAKNLTEAYQAAAGYTNDPTSNAGMYAAYVRQATAAGQTPISPESFIARVEYNKAYSTAKGKAAGEGAGGAGGNLKQSDIKSRESFPQNLKPYAKQSGNGTWYLDLSSIGAQTRGNLINQAGDIPVITDKNQAADLVNIKDAYGKLNTITIAMRDMTSGSALTRDLGGAGLSYLSALAQTDPKKAAATALNDSALDFLKAISGVQGFRGNQTAINQIKDSLPKITDTQDVAAQKLSYIAQQIADREAATVGGPGTKDVTNFVIRSEDQAKNALTDAGKKTPSMQGQITQVLSENNPDTGQPYSYLEAAQILGIDIPSQISGGGSFIFGSPQN